MPNNRFAVFILSHGRAETMTTLDAIRKAGYLGDYYIIVDDLDKQKDLYVRKYGDHVKVFNKLEWQKKTDTVTNTGENRTPVFARNACYEIAEELGLQYFTEFDDDLQSFSVRYEDKGSLKGSLIKDLDAVFEALIDFQEVSGAVSIGFANNGSFIGGVNGRFREGLVRNINRAFILRTDKRIEFKGILNEDSIVLERCNQTWRLAFEVCSVAQSCPERDTKAGGLKDLYQDNDEYVRAFYSIIAAPSCLKIIRKNGKITLSKSSENAFPKILSERWRKNA